ncbi:vitamin K epoxide reductase family protein [Saccharothrix coeruleofusca]|uniref:Vitamin K epoxide reductase domain-containing protein n=1 Tax=Saccharothrix coeruleofusca TaxID=33919 RepID=A0A918AK06_9PSEU|nr:vitamin K epoxide reductase family protein [Saccharothrix coeruleofusca]GGP47041.1 hypothetical protein GCM10010185_18500 [Saccharothrix coeruleofusca]
MTSNTRVSSLVLSLIGLAVSVYLTVSHYSTGLLVCAESSVVDCATVTSSEQSELLGVPVALLGALFFLFLTALCLPWAWRRRELDWVRLGAVGVGVLFVVYLVAAEFVLIGKICLWCTVVHVVTLALAGVLVTGALRRGSL